MASNLWKPTSEKDGNLVILFDKDPGKVVIRDSDGNIIATGTNTGPSNDRAQTVRFDAPGSAFSDVVVETENGESFTIGNGGNRYEGFSLSAPGSVGEPLEGGVEPVNPGFGGFGLGVPGVAPPGFLNPGLVETYPISPSPIEFNEIETAPYNFVNPLESVAATGEFNREQQGANFLEGMAQAKMLQKAELASIQEFATAISGTQQQIVGQENQFNQQQRLQAAEVAIPGIQGSLAGQRERAETLASGRLLTTAEDRAYELAARSTSADGSVVRGFGDDSIVGARQSDMLSAQQRLGLMATGENLLTNSLRTASGILMDQPLKANISQRLPAQPNVPFSTLASNQAATLNQLTTISPTAALQSEVQQEQFGTTLEQRTREFNTTGLYNADVFNSTQNFESQRFNSNQAYNARLAQVGILGANLAAMQGYQQSIFNAAAAGEQSQIQSEMNEQNNARMDQLIDAYRNNRDKNQLQQGIATLFGLAVNSPVVLDYVDRIVSGVGDYVSETFIDDDDDTDTTTIPEETTTTEPEEESTFVETEEENAEFGGNANVDITEEPVDTARMYQNYTAMRNESIDEILSRPFSSTSLYFNSGADLSLDNSDLSELGHMI